ncbi:MAG: hypothetical protein ABSF60_01420 [Verrucomicrobiota bacterium]|jgi:hypothetical protein
MTLQPETFNTQHPTSNIQVTGTEKLGGSVLNVECSMFVRNISWRATIWMDRHVAAGILPAVTGGIPKTAQKLLHKTMETTL